MSPHTRKWLRRLGRSCILLFVLLNMVAALYAWRFTHFTRSAAPHDARPERLSPAQKAWIALAGVPNARPVNKAVPSIRFAAPFWV